MSRVALTELVFLPTVPASYARNKEISVLKRGTTELATAYAAETGPMTLTQPLLTDAFGRPGGAGDVRAWFDVGSYDILIGSQVVPWEAAKGGSAGEGGGEGPEGPAGPEGPEGPPGKDGDENIAINHFGEDLSTARIEAAVNIWIGVGAPEHATPEDIVIDEEGLSSEDIVAALGFTPQDAATAATDTELAAEKSRAEGKEAELSATLGTLENLVTGAPLVFEGVKDCSANPKYPAAKPGNTYVVSVAGKIGGASGEQVEPGDALICTAEAAEGTQAAVGSKWVILDSATAAAALVKAEREARESADAIEKTRAEGAEGERLKKGENLKDIASAATARANLGAASIAEAEAAILKSLLTAKGELVGASASGTPVAHGAGADGKVLSALSSESDGLKWVGNADISEHGFSIIKGVEARTYRGFYIQLASGETKKLVGMQYSLGSGTKAKISILQNGAAVTGFKELEAKTAEAEVSGKSVSVAAKDRLDLKVESIEGSPEDLIVTLFFERTHS